MGVVPIVPGPAGLFRRTALMRAGGFRFGNDVFAEDAELSLRLLSFNWNIVAEEEMVAYTEAPSSMDGLLRQRYRWNRGTYQAIMANAYRLISGSIREKWLLGYLLSETVITPILNLGLILFFISHFMAYGESNLVGTWYFYLLGIDIMTMLLVTYNRKNRLWWLGLTVVYKVVYYYILLVWRIFALFEEWIGEPMSWDKLDRTGIFSREPT